MEQFKNAQLVLLPTVNETNIIKGKRNKLYKSSEIPDINYNKLINSVWTYMGLYVILDDKIKKHNWIYNKLSGIGRCVKNEEFNDGIVVIYDKQSYEVSEDLKNIKKIIATNDKSLTIPDKTNLNKFWYLPEIPQQFIEHYINEYNKGNVITDVLVEYERGLDEYNANWKIETESHYITTFKLKVNQDNTINIKTIKTSWNKEEVINLVKNALESSETLLDRDERWMGDILDCVFYNLNKKEFNNWVKENL